MEFLFDSGLSLEAKGLLSMGLLFQEREEKINIDLFISYSKENNFTISRLIKELLNRGYLIREKTSNGKFQYVYKFYKESLLLVSEN